MKTQLKKIQKGFTLVEIMIVVAIIGLLVAIALPNFIIARKKSQIKAAQASMKQIEGAVEQARLDDVEVTSANAEDDGVIIPKYLKVWPNVPGSLTYNFNGGTNDITCIIEGVETSESDNHFTAYDTVTP